MILKPLQKNPDIIVLLAAFVLANLRATMFVYLFPDPAVLLGPAWIEIGLWFLLLVAVFVLLVWDGQLADYFSLWRGNWPVALFALLAILSAAWSADPRVTTFRSLELLSASLLAAFIGLRSRPARLLEALFWSGAVALILSVAMVFGAPGAAVMDWQPFGGAWRGLFWHRNHLGSLAALFGIVFLSRAIVALERRKGTGVLDAAMYALSLVVLFFAGSVTGYIVSLALHGLVFLTWLWLRLRTYLRAWHYGLFAGALGVAGILVASNLDVVFGLFNRNTTLTGRVGLWSYLLNEVVPRRLWWGHGFGAIWTLDAFRESVRQNIGWPSQPLIADNGFLDILLHLGVAGLILLLALLFLLGMRSLRYGITEKTLTAFLPLFLLGYILVANIPFSLIAETEVFIWLLMLSALFLTTPGSGNAQRSP